MAAHYTTNPSSDPLASPYPPPTIRVEAIEAPFEKIRELEDDPSFLIFDDLYDFHPAIDNGFKSSTNNNIQLIEDELNSCVNGEDENKAYYEKQGTCAAESVAECHRLAAECHAERHRLAECH